MTLRVGLTGGIGSGKSTVAALLAERGALVVDTDAISRRLTAPGGAALPAIATVFGPEMLDDNGALDRARMRARVFSDPGARQSLERIIHPLVGAEADRQARSARPEQALVFDVPLLAESKHWRDRLDRILVVDCLNSTQLIRVRSRSGWEVGQIRSVITQQANRMHRRRIADAVLHNDGLSRQRLQEDVTKLWEAGFFTQTQAVPV